MIRFWNRSIKLENNRLTKSVFLWDYSIRNINWFSDIERMFENTNLGNILNDKSLCDMSSTKSQKLVSLVGMVNLIYCRH